MVKILLKWIIGIKKNENWYIKYSFLFFDSFYWIKIYLCYNKYNSYCRIIKYGYKL